jgi:hypothetical protein
VGRRSVETVASVACVLAVMGVGAQLVWNWNALSSGPRPAMKRRPVLLQRPGLTKYFPIIFQSPEFEIQKHDSWALQNL